jgi:ribosomal protein RSM22 (predicted rRNA methylase)
MQNYLIIRQWLEQRATHFTRPALMRAAETISERYRRISFARSESMTIRSDIEAMAYALTRLPATYAASYEVIGHLRAIWAEEANDGFSILDIGAGAASAALAALAYWPIMGVLNLVEPNRYLSALGQNLLSSLYPDHQVQWQKNNIKSLKGNDFMYDIVLASYMLNEIEHEEGQAGLELAISRLWPLTKRALVIIEPGTPAGYQLIMKMRDVLLGLNAHIAAPCPHHHRCPLLDSSEQNRWCHMSVRVERGSLHRQLKPGATMPYEDEKYSYLIAMRDVPARPRYRLIGHPRGSKPLEVDVCINNGSSAHMQVGKSHTDYKIVRRAKWGDAIF